MKSNKIFRLHISLQATSIDTSILFRFFSLWINVINILFIHTLRSVNFAYSLWKRNKRKTTRSFPFELNVIIRKMHNGIEDRNISWKRQVERFWSKTFALLSISRSNWNNSHNRHFIRFYAFFFLYIESNSIYTNEMKKKIVTKSARSRF